MHFTIKQAQYCKDNIIRIRLKRVVVDIHTCLNSL